MFNEVSENQELESMYGSVGGPESWENLQREQTKTGKRKGIIDAIVQAIADSSNPSSGAQTQAQVQNGQRNSDATLGANLGSIARSIGGRLFATGGTLRLNDQDFDYGDESNYGVPYEEYVPDEYSGDPYGQILNSGNTQVLPSNGAALVGEDGPELLRQDGRNVQITPVARPHADALMKAIEEQANFREKKPGLKSKIAAALLGGAQGYLSSSPAPATQRAAAMSAPMIHAAMAKLADGGNSQARRRLAESIQARTRAAQIEGDQLEYGARREHEQRMGKRAEDANTAAQIRWAISEQARRQQHAETMQAKKEAGERPRYMNVGGTLVGIDKEGNTQKLFEAPKPAVKEEFVTVTNKDGVFRVPKNTLGNAAPVVDANGKPLAGRERATGNPYTSMNAGQLFNSRKDEEAARALAGSVNMKMTLEKTPRTRENVELEVAKQARESNVPDHVYQMAVDYAVRGAQAPNKHEALLKQLLGGQPSGAGPSTSAPAPAPITVQPNTLQRR